MTLAGEVLALLTSWLPPNDVPDRPQMQVATVDADGRPDVRTALLSEWDEEGFAFHTDAASRKVAQLTGNDAVTLLLLWPNFTRQLVVRGRATPADTASLMRVYARRSAYLRQLAWLNTTELAQRPREERTVAWRRFAESHDVAALEPPSTWTGFVVVPDSLTFWQSDPQGPSHRIEYRLTTAGTWAAHHLAG